MKVGSCVDIGGIVDHHSLGVNVCFVDIGVIVDHHCLYFLFIMCKNFPWVFIFKLMFYQKSK